MFDALPQKAHSNVSGFTFEERKSVTIRCRSSVAISCSAAIAAPRRWIGPVVETRCVNSALSESTYGRVLGHLLIPTIDRGNHVY